MRAEDVEAAICFVGRSANNGGYCTHPYMHPLDEEDGSEDDWDPNDADNDDESSTSSSEAASLSSELSSIYGDDESVLSDQDALEDMQFIFDESSFADVDAAPALVLPREVFVRELQAAGRGLGCRGRGLSRDALRILLLFTETNVIASLRGEPSWCVFLQLHTVLCGALRIVVRCTASRAICD